MHFLIYTTVSVTQGNVNSESADSDFRKLEVKQDREFILNFAEPIEFG